MSDPQEDFKPVITDQQAKRVNAPIGAMILSVLVCVAAFLPVWLLNAFPEADTYQRDINVTAEAERAAGVAGFPPLSPELPDGWNSNYARWTAGGTDGVAHWEVGYVTPDDEFLSMTQTGEANPTWLAQQTEDAPEVGTRQVAGHSWQIRHQPDVDRSLILDFKGSTVIITGSASDREFDTLAAAVTEFLESAPEPGTTTNPAPAKTADAAVGP